jgi:hypothetical protein
MMKDTEIDEQNDTQTSHRWRRRGIHQTERHPPAHAPPTGIMGMCDKPSARGGGEVMRYTHPNKIEIEHDESLVQIRLYWYELLLIHVV